MQHSVKDHSFTGAWSIYKIIYCNEWPHNGLLLSLYGFLSLYSLIFLLLFALTIRCWLLSSFFLSHVFFFHVVRFLRQSRFLRFLCRDVHTENTQLACAHSRLLTLPPVVVGVHRAVHGPTLTLVQFLPLFLLVHRAIHGPMSRELCGNNRDAVFPVTSLCFPLQFKKRKFYWNTKSWQT